VERSTRFLLLLHLGDDKTAVNVEKMMRQAIVALPEQLQRSITWDQDAEMAAHARELHNAREAIGLSRPPAGRPGRVVQRDPLIALPVAARQE
jgi:hypothetical protein